MQEATTSILILMPYFGKWPFWMPLFLKSCEYNPDVNWLLIGDCGEPEGLPGNVDYQHSSFADYCERVSTCLELDFQPDNPYKLCDLKPAYGFLHEEDIQGYDFWGFGDLDLVYGSLRQVYTEEMLKKYDLISNHATRISGHLCLLRNTERMCVAFKKIPNWKAALQNPQHLAVDEKAFSRLFVKHKNFPQWLRRLTNQLYPMVRKSSCVERYTTPNGYIPWKDGTINYPTEWCWERGKIWNNLESNPKTPYPYFHFLAWKRGFNKVEIDLSGVEDGFRARVSEGGIKIVIK